MSLLSRVQDITEKGIMRKWTKMILPMHPQCELFQRGPLLQGGDPATTLWVNPRMRGADKVNPNSTVGKVFIHYTV